MSYDHNLWNSIRNELKNDKTRQEEMRVKTIKCRNNQTLRFYDLEIGKPDSSGYSLFICLHGGGQGAASMNDSQWNSIIPFEKGGFKSGTIAVAPRGITNTWNLHFVDESFPAITRLVENYIIFRNVNPNKVYLMGFSAGGDGTYSLSERIPYLFAACSPQAGHPNGINTVNLCNLPTYLAAGEKDGSFQRNKICVDYYKKIMAQNGKFCGNYIAKVEVVAGSGHSFKCWQTPRNSFFNGSNKASSSNDTAFTFMYSYTRNPNPREISCDVKTFLTPLRNHYTQRGNSFYNIQLGKNPPDMIQIQINYDNNTINVKEGNNFRINLLSSLFKKGNNVSVTANGKTEVYQLQKDQNYAKNNMKLFCDPYYGYDSYINIGEFTPEVKLAYIPNAPSLASKANTQNPTPAKINPQSKQDLIRDIMNKKKQAEEKIPNVSAPIKNAKNPAQYTNKGKNGGPYILIKLSQTDFAWHDNTQYWERQKRNDSLMGQDILHLKKVFYLNPHAQFYDIPKGNYFLLLRHNACQSFGLGYCNLFVKVDGKQVYKSPNIFKKDFNKIKNKKGLYDDFVMNIKSDMFNMANTHEIYAEIIGERVIKKDWDLDGFILLPDNCDGKIGNIYNQYFNNELFL